jgi:hypothetical protein
MRALLTSRFGVRLRLKRKLVDCVDRRHRSSHTTDTTLVDGIVVGLEVVVICPIDLPISLVRYLIADPDLAIRGRWPACWPSEPA